MWEALDKDGDDPDLSVYVQGMGTTQFEADNWRGTIKGEGETGIKDRARSAFEPLISTVLMKQGKEGPPHMLVLNVFGFSRGAATARHFVNLLGIQEELDKYFDRTWLDVQILVNFVGLFDTVSSFGLSLNGEYASNVDDLGLRFSNDVAKRVLHLYALDEYRTHFSLTTIDSARTALSKVNRVCVPMGFELGLPGAHSDVGGSYACDFNAPETEERSLPVTQTRDPYSEDRGIAPQTRKGPQAFVYKKGWYNPSLRLKGDLHKRIVTGDYYKVALTVMVKLAKEHTGAKYPDELLAMALQPEVQALQAQVLALVDNYAFVPGKPTRMAWSLDENQEPAQAQAFRRQFLHLSCRHNEAGISPRYADGDDTFKRHEAQG